MLVAVAVGAAATGGSPATTLNIPMADPTPAESTGYPGSVATSVSVSGDDKVRSGTRQLLSIEVVTAGDAKPQGTVSVVYTRDAGDYQEVRNYPYAGARIQVESSTLSKPGKYTADVAYSPDEGSVWEGSDGSFSFQVIGAGNS